MKLHDDVILGKHLAMGWRDDPKRLAFTFARYKFVAKMLQRKQNVLEVGCGDGFATQIVGQSVGRVIGISIDSHELPDSPDFICHDILEGPLGMVFDAAYSLDCLEHIKPEFTGMFLENIKHCCKGPVIIGMPSLESQVYASPRSKAGHVNCRSYDDLRLVMKKHFKEVFMFGMNDETLHTGYGPMCHYLIAIGVQ